jgi:hypothetical protein
MTAREDSLIAALAADLRPVRRLWHPAARAAAWGAGVLALGLALSMVADMAAVRLRLAEGPDLRWAMIGSVLTAGCAALAAFELSVPGRSAWWMALPLPTAALWLAASGWGCLRGWGIPGIAPADMHDAMGCATFIVLMSVPISAALLLMLRRAAPLWPGRVAAMGGLAAAAAAASLLTLFHPHDASAVDLVVHILAVGAVMLGSRASGALALA